MNVSSATLSLSLSPSSARQITNDDEYDTLDGLENAINDERQERLPESFFDLSPHTASQHELENDYQTPHGMERDQFHSQICRQPQLLFWQNSYSARTSGYSSKIDDAIDDPLNHSISGSCKLTFDEFSDTSQFINTNNCCENDVCPKYSMSSLSLSDMGASPSSPLEVSMNLHYQEAVEKDQQLQSSEKIKQATTDINDHNRCDPKDNDNDCQQLISDVNLRSDRCHNRSKFWEQENSQENDSLKDSNLKDTQILSSPRGLRSIRSTTKYLSSLGSINKPIACDITPVQKLIKKEEELRDVPSRSYHSIASHSPKTTSLRTTLDHLFELYKLKGGDPNFWPRFSCVIEEQRKVIHQKSNEVDGERKRIRLLEDDLSTARIRLKEMEKQLDETLQNSSTPESKATTPRVISSAYITSQLADIDELKRINSTLKDNLSQRDEMLQKLQPNVSQLETLLSVSETEKNYLEREVEMLKDRLSRAQDREENAQAEVKQNKSRWIEERKDLEDKHQKTLLDVRKQLIEEKKLNDELNEQMQVERKERQEDMDTLQERLEMVEAELERSQQQLELNELRNEDEQLKFNEDVEAQLEEKEKELVKAKEELEAVHQTNLELESQLCSIEESLSQELHNERQTTQQRLEELESQLTRAMTEIEMLRSESEKDKERVVALRRDCSRLQKILKQREKDTEHIEMLNAKLLEEKTTQEERINTEVELRTQKLSQELEAMIELRVNERYQDLSSKYEYDIKRYKREVEKLRLQLSNKHRNHHNIGLQPGDEVQQIKADIQQIYQMIGGTASSTNIGNGGIPKSSKVLECNNHPHYSQPMPSSNHHLAFGRQSSVVEGHHHSHRHYQEFNVPSDSDAAKTLSSEFNSADASKHCDIGAPLGTVQPSLHCYHNGVTDCHLQQHPHLYGYCHQCDEDSQHHWISRNSGDSNVVSNNKIRAQSKDQSLSRRNVRDKFKTEAKEHHTSRDRYFNQRQRQFPSTSPAIESELAFQENNEFMRGSLHRPSAPISSVHYAHQNSHCTGISEAPKTIEASASRSKVDRSQTNKVELTREVLETLNNLNTNTNTKS